MPTPTSSSTATAIRSAGSTTIDALLDSYKWGGGVGTGVSLSYSFPWASGNAVFSGPNGASYSLLNEPNATYHYGLNSTQQTAASAALQAWASVANISFQQVVDTVSSVGDIRFAWTSATDTTSTGELAWGWASYPNSTWPSGGDVWISTVSSGATDPNWSVGSSNYKSLLHEIGHALGLKHPFEDYPVLAGAQDSKQYTVMSYTNHPHSLFVRVTSNPDGSVSWSSFNVQPDTPMLYDVAAIQYLYGANQSYRTGNDVYTFDPSTPFFRTIWDAGGSDTISVSNFTKGCIIDLRPGYFSKITIESDSTAGYNWTSAPPQATYDGTDNLAIAYGTVIENAIGGSGNDTLTGNSADNTLNGGPGNDQLYGGAGNDLLDWDANSRGGADTMYGGPGDDQYVIDSLSDVVVELAGEGTDVIWAAQTYSIANIANVENLSLFGTQSANATGNALANVLRGNNAVNVLTGGAGNDTLLGGEGNDLLDGGGGLDTSIYAATRSLYVVTKTTIGFTIQNSSGADGNDTLTNVERFQFSDKGLAFDLGLNAAAANTVRIIGAAFDAPAIQQHPDYVGIGLNLFDAGNSMVTVCRLAIGAMGSPTNGVFVDTVYRNVVGVLPSPTEHNFYVGLLQGSGGSMTQADLLMLATNADVNAVNINLVGLQQTGVEFV